MGRGGVGGKGMGEEKEGEKESWIFDPPLRDHAYSNVRVIVLSKTEIKCCQS